MAWSSWAYIYDDWAHLKQNPVFRRMMLPRGLRFFMRSSVVRAVGLTMLALAAFEVFKYIQWGLLPILTAAVVFWFLVHAIQRYYCWTEITALAATGTLNDYLASGLSREDVFMGIAYPSRIAETVAVCMILGYFIYGSEYTALRIFLVVVIFLHARQLFRPPQISLTDAESYLRRRNPLALFFISFAVFVPLLIFFTIFYSIYFGSIYGAVTAGFSLTRSNVVYFLVGSYLASAYTARFPQVWFENWRLKRFYTRYASFDDLFEQYIVQGER